MRFNLKSAIVLIGLALLCNVPIYAQTTIRWEWATGEVQGSNSVINKIAVDTAGQLAVFGTIEDSLLFNAATIHGGGQDLFIGRYDAGGKPLLATLVSPGNGTEWAGDIAVDLEGNVYITGSFNNNITFSGATSSITLSTSGNEDMFVAKYDKFNNVIWAAKAGGVNNDKGTAIALDDAGNVYVGGHYGKDATGAPSAIFGTTTVTGNTKADMFLAAYSPSGNFQWVKSNGGNGDETVADLVMVNGYAYITGLFSGYTSFGNTICFSRGANDIYLAKYQLNGAWLEWSTVMGSPGNDMVAGLAMDGSNNVYIGGTFAGDTIYFGGIKLPLQNQTTDVFVAKYAPAAQPIWAKAPLNNGITNVTGIAMSNKHELHIAGYFDDSLTFGGTGIKSAGLSDAFVAGYDITGNEQWLQHVRGSGDNIGGDMVIDKDGKTYVNIDNYSDAYFDNIFFPSLTPTSTYHPRHMCVAKLDTAVKIVTTNIATTEGKVQHIYPNPAGNVLYTPVNTNDYNTVVITDIMGREVYHAPVAASIDISRLPNGVYNIRFSGSKGILVERLLIER